MSREYTEEEVRKIFLENLWDNIDWWEKESQVPGLHEKMSGLVFSILAMLDGSGKMPGFIVAPMPHENDKKYRQENDDNWYPENHDSNIKCDIGGSLHELFYLHEKPRQISKSISK